ncbi:ATP-dependent helicase [Cupriavidus alkaliphilus]|uniref:ATP-dependent helicase n=1 Tax=Cupriavidus alkaliphilus TaxID=942866 RepID=UPI001609FC6A|nr:ATP-dependent helicase [Cupriavidus alkaliphilus]MBB3014028.1 DNA helicase-2/ATP-dependent DNA helicase PcrA [Cupriavidus alkaliphilus]
MSEAFKARLSSDQLSVATHVHGSLLVVAGPGSGKTRVLTERIRHLLTSVPGHFRVLALTFTNKAADEMKERLADLGEERERAFIGTLHGFCLEVLTERGKLVGIEGAPNIFEQAKDRREVLEKAIENDPFLSAELEEIDDPKERKRRVDKWLASISYAKSHPITCAVVEDEGIRRVIEAYDAGMRASNAYDFDDLLLLTYQLLIDNPKLGDIYRRLYKFICIDEAQDMNEAQYAVICALCGETHRDVMMVGDPRQSIYGFNKSGPEYMDRFGAEFGAKRVELTANFRSSRAVVKFAQTLDSSYMVHQQLPVPGNVEVLRGEDEKHEATLIADELQRLFAEGHPDVEGGLQPSKCAVLGRTRYALLSIEDEFKERGIEFFKRLSANHENESDLVEDFLIALRILANPKDRLHLAMLTKRWRLPESRVSEDFVANLTALAASSNDPKCAAVRDAIAAAAKNPARVNLMPALDALKSHADTLKEAERLPIYEDVAVLSQEWDQFLRTATGPKNLSAFISSKALGGTQKASRDGVAILTVHASKGLEFDVVFMAGMADGVFPDYRATGPAQQAEETRNAFVAATRSRRLLYLTYPASRVMPWGDERRQRPSPFLNGAQL